MIINSLLSLVSASIITYVVYLNSNKKDADESIFNNNTYPIFICSFLIIFFILLSTNSNNQIKGGGRNGDMETALHSALKHVSHDIPPF